MHDEDDFPPVRLEDIMAEIQEHDASHLVTSERNSVNGYVTFRFYDMDDELQIKMTFDDLSEDMGVRAKAVLDYLASAEGFVLEADIQRVWDRDPNAAPAMPA